MKKISALLLSLVLLFTFAACNSSDSAVSITEATTVDTESLNIATTTINEKFNEIKNKDSAEFFNALMGADQSDELSDAEKEVAVQIFDTVKKSFNYKLVSTKRIDDKTIKATIEITSVDGNVAAGKFYEELLNYLNSDDTSDAPLTDEEIDLKIMDFLATAFANSGTITNKIAIEITLVDGKWIISEKDADLFGLFCQNFSTRFKELGEDLSNSVS
ncbi:MAG: hypothetical protein E7536_03995 [Ruminococcaceae bacterium]|nr:hypothetical protein [Oscillospiraceae bacterium]